MCQNLGARVYMNKKDWVVLTIGIIVPVIIYVITRLVKK
jgi:hypothetical protein